MSSDTFKIAKTPTILVTGKNGQVGWELQRSLQPFGKIIAMNRDHLDLSNSNSVREVIREIQPDIIVNAAAYTAVDKAEEEIALAYQVNAISPGVMAEEAKKLNALLIHYSTDYVFNGEKDLLYEETDTPNPINAYGSSKLAGEKAIQESGCDYLIFRASWIFASRAQNFLLSILRLAQERKELNIVSDQIGSPTSARFIADATAQIITQVINEYKQDEFISGIYNLVSSECTSWHGFASAILESAREIIPEHNIITESIHPIPTTGYPTPAKRPMNSRLSTEAIIERFNIFLSDWQTQMKLCIEELK